MHNSIKEAHEARSRFFTYNRCGFDRSPPEIQGLKDATISSIVPQSISSSNRGYSMGGGRDAAGVEHAVGAMVGKGVIGNGGTGSQRGRDCRLGSDDGMTNESEGLVCRGMGGRGRGSGDFNRCGRRICGLRFNSASLESMGCSYPSDIKKRNDDWEAGNDVFEVEKADDHRQTLGYCRSCWRSFSWS